MSICSDSMFDLPDDVFVDEAFDDYVPDDHCVKCKIKMTYSEEENRYECECGQISYNTLSEEHLNTDSRENHNTSKVSAVQLRFKGDNSAALQRGLISSTSSYTKTRNRTVKKQLESWLYQSREIKIPTNIREATVEFFIDKVTPKTITRGAVRKGIMAAVLYYKCKEINYGMSVTEICKAMEVSRYDWSRGDSRLRELEAKGCFELPSCEDCLEVSEGYLNMFFPRLGINPEPVYFEFAIDLIELMNNPKVGKLAKNSMPRSKCAGIIHLLCKHRPEISISEKDIITKCNISKATFTRVSSKVEEILYGVDPKYKKRKKKLIKIFEKIGYKQPKK